MLSVLFPLPFRQPEFGHMVTPSCKGSCSVQLIFYTGCHVLAKNWEGRENEDGH